MRSGADDLAEAIFAIVAAIVNVAALAVRIALPVVLTIALRSLQAQHAVLDAAFTRASHLFLQGAPIGPSVRFGATVALYASVVGPTLMMGALLAMNVSLFLYAGGFGALAGGIIGAFGLMQSAAPNDDGLSSLRFWE